MPKPSRRQHYVTLDKAARLAEGLRSAASETVKGNPKVRSFVVAAVPSREALGFAVSSFRSLSPQEQPGATPRRTEWEKSRIPRFVTLAKGTRSSLEGIATETAATPAKPLKGVHTGADTGVYRTTAETVAEMSKRTLKAETKGNDRQISTHFNDPFDWVQPAQVTTKGATTGVGRARTR